MKILLDTHIFLWFISGDSRLSADIRDVIRDLDNNLIAEKKIMMENKKRLTFICNLRYFSSIENIILRLQYNTALANL